MQPLQQQQSITSSVSKEPLWDKQSALVRLGNNHALLEKVATLFVSQANDTTHNLLSAITQHNIEKIKQLSHYLKGGAADVGLTRLYAHCAFIEDQARAGNLAAINAVVAPFKQTVADTLACIEAQRQQQ